MSLPSITISDCKTAKWISIVGAIITIGTAIGFFINLSKYRKETDEKEKNKYNKNIYGFGIPCGLILMVTIYYLYVYFRYGCGSILDMAEKIAAHPDIVEYNN